MLTVDVRCRHHNLRLRIWLGILLLLARHLPPDNVLPDIIFLRQIEELPDLSRPFWSKPLGHDVVGQAGDLIGTMFDNHQGENTYVRSYDASADRLASSLTTSTRTITRVAVREEEPNTMGDEDTLLHGEPLLIVTACDAKYIFFPFIAKKICSNFL